MLKFDYSSASLDVKKSFINDFKNLSAYKQKALLDSGNFTNDQKAEILNGAGLHIAEDGSLVANTALLKENTEETLKNAASKDVKSDASAKSATTEGIETVGVELNEEAKEEQNEEIVKGSALKVIDNAQTVKGAVAQGTDATATNVNTGAKLGLAGAYKALWASMKPVITAALPYLGMAVGVAAVVAIMNKLIVTYDEAHEAMDEAQSKYDETTSSLEDLRTEYQTTEDKIKELNALKESDGLSIVEENELNTLKAQNEELDRQIKLKEQLQEAQGKQLADAAKEAMTKGTHSVAQSVAMGDETGESTFAGAVQNLTDQQEVDKSIDLVKDYETKVEEINKSIADTEMKIANEKNHFVKSSLERSLNNQKDELKKYETSIETLYVNIDTRAASMQENLDALKLDPEANVEEIKELEEALSAIESMDLDDVGKALKKVENYFDGSLTSSTIKQKIIQMEDFQDGTIDASDALSLLGLTLEDLGITGAHSKQIFNDYFDDFRSDAKQAEKAAKAVEGSLSSIQTANESANDDAAWSTVTELFESAKELYDKKKFGTDDFQEMAQFIAPEDAKLNVTKGDIKADDYIELWDKYYKNFKKYFDSENPLKAAVNAQNKLVSEGLGKKGSDGIIRWTDEFRSSAQVADALGVSLEAAEVIMDNLASHGAEFTYEVEEGGKTVTKEMFRAGEAIGDYESALTGMRSVYEQLDDDNPFKEELKTSIEASEKELEGFKEDVGSLKNEKPVIEIQFKYSLAQLESEIQQLENAYENSGKADDLGALVAKKQDKQDLLLTHDNKKDITKSEDYQVLETSLKQWSNELMSNTNLDEASRKELLQQKNSILELMNTWTELYDVAENPITWDKFINSKDAKDALDQIEQETKLSKDEILDLLSEIENSDFFKDGEYKKKVTVETSTPKSTNPGAETGSEKMDGVVITFDAKLNKDRVEKELNELKEGQRIEFYAEGTDGLDHLVQAFKDGNGEIHYEVIVDGELPQEIDWNDEKYINFSSTGSKDVQKEADATKKRLDKVPEEVLTIFDQNGANSVMKDATSVKNAIENVPDDLTIAFKESGITNLKTKIQGLIDKLTSYKDALEEATGEKNVPTVRGVMQATGTVHHKGTAHVLGINNDIPDDSLTNSRYRTDNDDIALTGELGREIVVHGDEWWTVGEDGAEFTHIPSNSIVFNHKQTEELLGKGKTKSRGKVHAGGTAFLEGNAYSGMPDLTTPNQHSSDSNKDSKNNKDKSDSEKYDWIEKLLQKIQRAIEKLSKTADATYKKWSTRNDAILDQIKEVRKEKSKTELAKERYETEAKNVGLSKKYRNLVENGKIDITTVKSEKTREKIEEYTKWYDKVKECEDALQDLADTEASLYMQAFDNVSAKYDAILERVDWRQSMLDEYISQAEAKGQIVSAEYYRGKIKGEENRLGYLTKERDALYKKLEQAVDNGIEVGSEDWNTMVNEINAVTLEIESAETAILEFENNIRDCEWEAFDKLQEQISNITDEAEFLIELMSNDDMYDDDGKLTEEGLATMGLHGQNYNVYMEQAAQYAEEIKKLEEDIAKDPKNQDLIERKQELIELQRESILAAEDEKQAIVDMVEEGINKELEALQELIDKKKEELQSQKELYEYQKKMKDLTKEHASVQKQLAAYQGDTSEENKARVQQLKVKLEESQEAIEEAEYEKYMSDQEELLDSMYEEYEEMLNARLDNVDALIEETIHEINASAGDIQKTLEEQAAEVGVTLSDEMNSIWSGADGEKSVLSTFEQGVATGLTTVNSTLETMNTNLIGMITALNKIANTDVKGIPTENAFNSDEAKFAKNVDGLTQGDGHLKDKVKDLLDNKNNTTNKNNKNNKNNKDNKITKGEKVTFKSGKYTARADGTGASGKQKLGEKVYVTSIKSGAKRPYHIAQDKAGKKPLGWVKKEQLKGYYTGEKNIDKDQWAITQEKGLEAIMHNGSILTPLAKGSSVFNADATDNLYDFMNNPYEFIKANIDLQQLSSVPRLHEFGNYEYSGDMSFELILPNVTNYEEFKYAMKHDKDIERFIQSVSVDKMMGKSSLRKYK